MGEALEQTWGTFRYNVYLLIGYLATIAGSASSRNHTSTAAPFAALPIKVIPRRNSAIAAGATAITATAWSTSATMSISKRVIRTIMRTEIQASLTER
jgi:hypothetical protein